MNKYQISEEAERFFEWPNPAQKTHVTLTSCVLFAEHIARKTSEEHEFTADALRGEIARLNSAVCCANALLNLAPIVARRGAVKQAHDVLREALAMPTDESRRDLTLGLAERLEAMAAGWLCAGLPDAELPREAAREIRRMATALQDADTIMGHDDAETEWRNKWAGLWPNVAGKAGAKATGRSESARTLG